MTENKTNDYVYRNEVSVCGKIIFKRAVKNGNLFAISISRRLKNPKVNEETGKYEYMRLRTVDVFFEGATGKMYDKLYEVGDFVSITGVTQKTRNNYLARNMVKIIGLTMLPKVIRQHETRDKNYVTIRGKIDHINVLNDNYILCDVYTNVHKRFRNPNTENETVTHFEDDFISVTPVGIIRNQDAKEAAKELTKGTWIDISGYIDVKKIKLVDDSVITETRIIAQNVYIVGMTQKTS